MSDEYMDDDFESEDALTLDVADMDGEGLDEEGSVFEELEDIDFAALGIHADEPTQAKPGSERKVLTLAARYAAGLPLWHSNDRYDHAPAQPNLTGLKFDA